MTLVCSVCNKISKSTILYECEHMVCISCTDSSSNDRQECPLCVDTINHLHNNNNNNNQMGQDPISGHNSNTYPTFNPDLRNSTQSRSQIHQQRFNTEEAPITSERESSFYFEWSNQKKPEPKIPPHPSFNFHNNTLIGVPHFAPSSYHTTDSHPTGTSNSSASQSQTKKKTQYQTPLLSHIHNNNHQKSISESDESPAAQNSSSSFYTSLFCQKHEQPLSFYNTQTKNLLCASCLYLSVNRRSVNSVYNAQNHILPLKNCHQMIRNELRKFGQELLTISSKIDESLRICRHSRSVIETNFSAVVSEIGAVTEAMIKEIRMRQKMITDSITDLLKTKTNEYIEAEKELSKFRDYIRQFKCAAASRKGAAEKVEDVAYLFQSGKELKQMLVSVRTEYKQFGLAELNLLRFNKREFQESLQNCFRLNNVTSAGAVANSSGSGGVVMGGGDSASKSPNKKMVMNTSMYGQGTFGRKSLHGHYSTNNNSSKEGQKGVRSISYLGMMKKGHSKNVSSLN